MFETQQPTVIVPFKKGSASKMVMDMAHIFGVINASELDTQFIRDCYGSVYFTENYDSLPLVVRMWLKYERWTELLKLAELFDCDSNGSQILYCDFMDKNAERVNAGPLIITNGEVAICLAPRILSEDDFEVKQETQLNDVLGEPAASNGNNKTKSEGKE